MDYIVNQLDFLYKKGDCCDYAIIYVCRNIPFSRLQWGHSVEFLVNVG